MEKLGLIPFQILEGYLYAYDEQKLIWCKEIGSNTWQLMDKLNNANF